MFDNQYTKMQQCFYDAVASEWTIENRDPVVGTFDAHNEWEEYEKLFEGLEANSFSSYRVLDFGCGPGRNIVRYHDRFARIDGADISQLNLEAACVWMNANNISPDTATLYKTNGVALDGIPNETYDIVMSTIAMQHIAVYDIRRSILLEMKRVLKHGGCITIQMGFGGSKNPTAAYTENAYSTTQTNGAHDVRIEQVSEVENDLMSMGYENFSYRLGKTGPGDVHKQWIYFQAFKP